jgi:formylglycine-generating enzyme required for sulfatase activity
MITFAYLFFNLSCVSPDYSEEPLDKFGVEPFQIAKFPVMNAQFQAFIDDGGYQEERYWKDLAKRETAPGMPTWSEPNHPRKTVNWYEAMAFARWLSAKLGQIVRLPSESEWQWAAAADSDFVYPYGKTFDASKSNTSESGIGRTTPVDGYPQGASPFGVFDLSGNVFEWCLNRYADAKSVNVSSSESRVVRGGAWGNNQGLARAAYRLGGDPFSRSLDLGFRVVCVPSGSL